MDAHRPTDQAVDVLVVGAGFAGLYAAYRARRAGRAVVAIEAGDGVGGTWYWNRYPGPRCDVESIDYSYSFDPELEQTWTWTWTERYAAQPEILAYLNHVAERYDLLPHIRFGRRVSRAVFDEEASEWSLRTVPDQNTDLAANDIAREFVEAKIREIVRDPQTAEDLIPTDHPIGTKRIVTDSGYYALFNRPDVRLVNRREPIREVTPCGVKTKGAAYELDALVFATGFDAMTGALTRIDLQGARGARIGEVWRDGPLTYLGLTVPGFPDLVTLSGPGSPSVLALMVLHAEQQVEWAVDLIEACLRDRISEFEPGATPPRSGPSTSPRWPSRRCSPAPTRGGSAPTSRARSVRSCPTSAASATTDGSATGSGQPASRASCSPAPDRPHREERVH
jgi:cation diffusion facilitator CzcD-associated flavoprotein CzcO